METSGLRSEPGVGENDPSTMSGASTDEIQKQESIPVGCVPPARNRTEVSLTETPPPSREQNHRQV